MEEVCGRSIPQLEQASKRACGSEVCSPTVLSVSGLTSLDSAPGGAGVVARILRAFEEIRGGWTQHP